MKLVREYTDRDTFTCVFGVIIMNHTHLYQRIYMILVIRLCVELLLLLLRCIFKTNTKVKTLINEHGCHVVEGRC